MNIIDHCFNFQSASEKKEKKMGKKALYAPSDSQDSNIFIQHSDTSPPITDRGFYYIDFLMSKGSKVKSHDCDLKRNAMKREDQILVRLS